MRMNTGIPLMVEQPNVMAAMGQGAEAAMLANAGQRENALYGLFREQGPGIMSGDPAAMNALAALDPRMAFDMVAPPEPADEYGRYAAEETAAGRTPLSRIEYAGAKRGPGMSVTTPDGTRVVMGGADAPAAGNVPAGYQRRFDPATGSYVDEAIPGSEPAAEAEMVSDAARMAAANYQRKFELVDDKLDEAIELLDKRGRGVAGVGAFLANLPETDARSFKAIVDTIKANLGFEELQAMREASSTGGALGQVTERELAFLQATSGNLDTAQNPAQLMSILADIKTRRAEFAAERAAILGGAKPQGGSAADVSAIDAMTIDELIGADVSSMTNEQMLRLQQRLDEAGL